MEGAFAGRGIPARLAFALLRFCARAVSGKLGVGLAQKAKAMGRIAARLWWPCVPVLALAWWLGAPAFADGMPQLRQETYPSQIFWLLCSLAILYLLISRLALPRIQRTLEMRDRQINDDLEAAETQRSEALLVEADFQASLAGARQRRAAILAETKEQTAELIAQRERVLSEELLVRVEEGRRELERARSQALREARAASAGLVSITLRRVAELEIEESEIESIAGPLLDEQLG